MKRKEVAHQFRARVMQIRANLKADHRKRMEPQLNFPSPSPAIERYGRHCPICHEKRDVNAPDAVTNCCCQLVCHGCQSRFHDAFLPCPLCGIHLRSEAEQVKGIHRFADEEWDPLAMRTLGEHYRDGCMGLEPDAEKQVHYVRLACELGEPEAGVILAMMYMEGDCIARDDREALVWYTFAAYAGDAKGQFMLACHKERTANRCRNKAGLEEAARWVLLSAEQGFLQAMYKMGAFYANGVGVRKDRAASKLWYTKATTTECCQSLEASEIEKNREHMRETETAVPPAAP